MFPLMMKGGVFEGGHGLEIPHAAFKGNEAWLLLWHMEQMNGVIRILISLFGLWMCS